MSVPTGSDASADPAESSREPNDTDETEQPTDGGDSALTRNRGASSDDLLDRVVDWARHWKAWSLAALSLAVVGWAAFLQPQASPKGYIPIFAGFALLAVGFVYLQEETQIHVVST
jgi:hypothetical protein